MSKEKRLVAENGKSFPLLLAGNAQIVYMVPRSGDSERTPFRNALSILLTLNFASKFTVGQLGNLGDDFNGPGTIANTTVHMHMYMYMCMDMYMYMHMHMCMCMS